MSECKTRYDVGIELVKEANSRINEIIHEYNSLLKHQYGDNYVPCCEFDMGVQVNVETDQFTLEPPFYSEFYNDDGSVHFISKIIDGVNVTENCRVKNNDIKE